MKRQIDRSWFDAIETHPAEDAKLDFAVTLERALSSANISRSDLARVIGSSPAWITKVLRGDANLTIETMCELAAAIDHDLHVHLAPKIAAVKWFEAFECNAFSTKKQGSEAAAGWEKLYRGHHGKRNAVAA